MLFRTYPYEPSPIVMAASLTIFIGPVPDVNIPTASLFPVSIVEPAFNVMLFPVENIPTPLSPTFTFEPAFRVTFFPYIP